ncbi:hypothetical protein SAMN05421640_3213 [Ekhidna lutea]|uniref:Uncharacterized protein n=1 Tax=Ekhidna lutea TaxID=447679 RepID=A0A239LG86_EKHLU|nr:hypothetical protein [Ekhidna lutea]SNT28952.1 hypothetical protein SAMN05421640_3213 [Ekhidna lutea]
MKNLILFVFATLVSLLSFSQNTTGMIRPAESFRNPFDFNLFYMPREKVVEFKNLETKAEFDSLRIVLYQEKLKTYEERIFLADSATQLRKMEADFWNSKLLANDAMLEEERKTNVHLRADIQRIRQSRIYYFLGGIIATSVVVGALK